MGPELAQLIAGWGDELDVWELFQRDAQGRTGLYRGQLVSELAAERPTLVPRLVEALRRGLQSQDANEREAALHGAGALVQEVDFAPELAGLFDLAPELTRTAPFLEVVARQPASSALTGIIDRVLAAPVAADAQGALARVLVRHRPALVTDLLLAAAVDETPADIPRLRALVRASSPGDIEALADRIATEGQGAAKRASDLFYAAYEADQQPGAYDRWAGLHTRMGLSLEGAPARPFESDEDRARRERFAAMMARLAAEEEAAKVARLPDAVVLAPAVWIDALRVPEGPPVELMELLKRHGVSVLRSKALLDAVDGALAQLGWDAAARAAARKRVTEVTIDRAAGDAADEVAIARAAGLDAVYTVGPATGQSRDGVTFQPVHELISLLQRS